MGAGSRACYLLAAGCGASLIVGAAPDAGAGLAAGAALVPGVSLIIGALLPAGLGVTWMRLVPWVTVGIADLVGGGLLGIRFGCAA